MDKIYFINKMKRLRDVSIEVSLESFELPPGRRPRQSDINRSKFFNSFNKQEQERIQDLISVSIDQALFSFFCILDHVSFIEDDEEKTQFELWAVKNGERVLINDPSQEELHNLYNDLVLDKD